jgi:hypothetical protein
MERNDGVAGRFFVAEDRRFRENQRKYPACLLEDGKTNRYTHGIEMDRTSY